MADTPRQHPTELLPWLVNGTLAGSEREAVESHLADCEHCRAEVRLLQAMRGGVKSTAPVGAGELGWRRLRRDLHGTPRSVTPRWVMPAAVAACLVIVAQTAMLVIQRPEPARYEPLSGPAVEAQAQVRFVPQASEGELRALLLEAGVRIVDGPSAAGVYRLSVEPGRDLDEAARVLRARPDLIGHFALEP